MCLKTEAGMVHSIGEIRIDEPGDLPKFLQNFRYVIFEEAEDMLGLIYHAVCIDLELDSRGTMPKEAYRGLKNTIHSFIDVTIRHTADKSEAYAALKELINKRGETRELVDKAYKQVLERKQDQFLTISEDLHNCILSKLQREAMAHEFAHFYISASDNEEIENIDKPQSIPDKTIKQAVALNYLLYSNLFRKTKMFIT